MSAVLRVRDQLISNNGTGRSGTFVSLDDDSMSVIIDFLELHLDATAKVDGPAVAIEMPDESSASVVTYEIGAQLLIDKILDARTLLDEVQIVVTPFWQKLDVIALIAGEALAL